MSNGVITKNDSVGCEVIPISDSFRSLLNRHLRERNDMMPDLLFIQFSLLLDLEFT